MKKLILVVLSFLVMPTYVDAIMVSEEVKPDKSVEITITFAKEEMDLFCLDKLNPKEWIRNWCDVNVKYQDKLIGEELYKDLIQVTPENKAAKKAEKKLKRDEQIQKQIDEGGEGVIYK